MKIIFFILGFFAVLFLVYVVVQYIKYFRTKARFNKDKQAILDLERQAKENSINE